jgi:hypothetical protein
MKCGYARVSSDGQSVDAQVRQLTKAGCKKVFREVASGAKTNRAASALARSACTGRRADGDAARPAGAINPRPVEHPCRYHRQESRFPLASRMLKKAEQMVNVICQALCKPLIYIIREIT